jgi:hypothetical protein
MMARRNLRKDLESDVFDGHFGLCLAYGKLPRPDYAYGIYHAAELANRLGLPKMSVIEFGVAGGRGLVAMEQIATEVEKIFPITIELFGFDSATGLPEPVDYRDLAYIFARGEYEMDEPKLRSALTRARLVLGNVADTVPSFFKKHSPAPIGFVAFDLDLYSSTVDALRTFDAQQESVLPRLYCYFDDIIDGDFILDNEWVGELLAIKEFNEGHPLRKIAPINGLRHKRNLEKNWSKKVVAVRAGVAVVVAPGHSFILVGKESLGIEKVGNRVAMPFLEHNGQHWGNPSDDATAISEIARMRDAGADFIFFPQDEFWWLDHYVGFDDYLRSKFPAVIDTAEVIGFDLRAASQSTAQASRNAAYHELMTDFGLDRDELWNDKMFVLHTFDHPLYNRYVRIGRSQAPLE